MKLSKRVQIPKLLLLFLMFWLNAPGISYAQISGHNAISGTISIMASQQSSGNSQAGNRYYQYFHQRTGNARHGTNHPASPFSKVVVYLTPVNFQVVVPPVKPHPKLIQKNIAFEPAVLPITVHTTVDIINEDHFYHNVFSLSPLARFDIGRRPTGYVYPQQFDKVGVVQVFCDIHSNMTAYILVLDTPFYTKPDSTGNYMLKNLPDGEYQIHFYSPDTEQKILSLTLSGSESKMLNEKLN